MKHSTKCHGMMKQSSTRGALRATTRAVLWLAGLATRRASVNAKWARHFRALLALRERLLRESVELLEKASEPLEPYSTDIMHSATEEFGHEFALSRLSTIQDALFEVDEAIERILNGSYGVCEETGRTIPEARLKAAPWTRFARDVEERLEREGIVSGLHLSRVGLVRGPLGDDGEVFEGTGEEETGGSVANDEALRCVDSSFVRSNRDLAVPRHRRSFAHH
jgi:RNA polymerase-binding transcription factor DksA